MDNTGTIPHSAIAVDNLVALERKHRLSNSKGDLVIECDICRINKHGKPVTKDDIISWAAANYPCPTLTAARVAASRETLVAVALILGGDKQ